MTNIDKIIKIPELAVVMLVGPSGCGKSSFAQKHFKSTEILSSDYCRTLVSDNENDQAATKDAFEILHFIASKRLIAGRLVVVDATNVQPDARKSLVDLARKHHVIPVAIVLDIPKEICHERNQNRPDRQFGKHVVRNQSDQLHRSLKNLHKEGVSKVYLLNSVEEVDNVVIKRTQLWNNLKHERGPFDLIGDIHGCFDELYALLIKLGYQIQKDQQYIVTHPEDRKVILVGDLVDRGPNTPEVLRIVMDMVESGVAFCVNGNHDDKLKRKLQGHNVKIAHGLAESLVQLESESQEFKDKVIKFLDGLISHYVLDDAKLAVAHAGLKLQYIGRGSPRIREFCMYGETTGEINEFGLPVRYSWAQDYRGNTMIVYGHTPIPEVEWLNNTINIDTGCVFGHKLTALRYPEKELVDVQAKQVYSKPAQPFNHKAETNSRNDMLDIDDVTGKRIVTTSLHNNITLREENTIAALEVMSRFTIDPRWLIYLPPTMSPTETSKEIELLEHPNEAFTFYRNHGVEKLICEEKHMGSRAIIVVCKNNGAARKRFGTNGNEIGVCYTRTGRSFFNTPDVEQEFLVRVSQAISKARLWEIFNTDWFCFNCELMPWSAKANTLLEQQYAPVGASASAVLPNAVALLEKIAGKMEGSEVLLQKFQARAKMITLYQDAYRRYCWPVNSIVDYKLAPFHILASEDNFNMDKDHLWHLEIIDRLCDIDPELFQEVDYRLVDTNNLNSCAEATAWWQKMTADGGEGMVVKPLNFTVKGKKGLIQPGIKCRGREYLRIIYGPEYTAPEHLKRLRSRALGAKRSLALREYALGYEALQRFVNKEPLYRVHELVFGVLALESEPVDPRL
ncbi:polynucleotide kinase-phosphatase [Candidatus Tisiphia endosymbiont of Nemotelus uliginosus]|uniref:polynucleotide kinase-phosphatase n=1 Tax=Candidatus Tisiphia endosymbiont of Nemotelus uliginosus TaxID=3077926 RepID=UPI0035C8B38E